MQGRRLLGEDPQDWDDPQSWTRKHAGRAGAAPGMGPGPPWASVGLRRSPSAQSGGRGPASPPSKAPGGERTPEGRRRGPGRDKPPGPGDARRGEKPLPFHFLPGGGGNQVSGLRWGCSAPWRPCSRLPVPRALRRVRAPGAPGARRAHSAPHPAQEARRGGRGGRRLPPHCALTVPSGLPRFRARQPAAVAPSERLDRPRRAMPAG